MGRKGKKMAFAPVLLDELLKAYQRRLRATHRRLARVPLAAE
jgi:hypothetical protein